MNATRAHSRDLAIHAETRKDKNASCEQSEWNCPLHCLREAHCRKLPDERQGQSVKDIPHDLNHQANRQNKAQDQEGEKEA